MDTLPIACTLSDSGLQERQAMLRQHLGAHVREVLPLDEGYAFRFEAGEAVLRNLVEVIDQERRCCRFLQFTLRVAPDLGPVWLELTGPEGTKAFIEETFLR